MKRNIFYGWVVVTCVFVVLFLCFGVAYSFAAFFTVFQEEFGAGRSGVSLVFSLASFLFFGLGALTGPMSDKWGAKRIVAAGMVLTGAGLLVASRATELWQLYVFYGLSVGLGVGFTYVPAIGAVQRWFIRKRGLASGFAVSGIGAGTLVVPPAAVALLTVTDWRGAYMVMGAFTLILGLIAAKFIENSPHDRGLFPDGEMLDPSVETKPVAIGGASVREALHSGPFWALYVASLMAAVGIFMPFVHLAPYAQDYGHNEGFAVFLVSLVGVGSIAGRFAMGGVADSWGRKPSLTVAFAGIGVLLLVWSLSSAAWALVTFALLFGVFYGGFVALIPALTVDYFGGRNAGGIIGFLYTNAAIGSLLGPPMAGLAFDMGQGYGVPLSIAGGLGLLAAAIIFLMPDPRKWSPASWH